jgi:RsiW-degrading membrane proteinase PrsW (M82 family)
MSRRLRTEALATARPPDRRARAAFAVSLVLIVAAFGSFAALCAGLSGLDALLSNPVVGLVSAFTAVACAMPYLVFLLWLDRNESEPLWLLGSALLWGAVFATGWSLLFNDTFGWLARAVVADPEVAAQLTASLSAPLVEEVTKGMALGVLYVLFKRHLDSVLDGVIYGAMVGIGFAIFENFLYYSRTGSVGGALVLTAIRGVITAVGSHPAFTALTGLGVGLFRVARRGLWRWALPPFFLSLAIFAHFAWNTFTGLLMTRDAVVNVFVSLPLAVTLFQLPNVVLLAGVAVLASWHESRVIREWLHGEEALAPGEIDEILPWWRRSVRGASLLARFQWRAWWASRRRYRLLVRLAFERWHQAREADHDPGEAQLHARSVLALRAALRADRAT